MGRSGRTHRQGGSVEREMGRHRCCDAKMLVFEPQNDAHPKGERRVGNFARRGAAEIGDDRVRKGE
jgi:hypothetical protein